MEFLGSAMGTAEGLREYIKALRESRGFTQEQAAAAGGIDRRTYQDWERGVIDTLKAPVLLRLIKQLRGSFEALERLASDDITEQEARDLVRHYQTEAQNLTDDQLRAAITDFEREAEEDKSFLAAWQGFIAGWRARQVKSRP